MDYQEFIKEYKNGTRIQTIMKNNPPYEIYLYYRRACYNKEIIPIRHTVKKKMGKPIKNYNYNTKTNTYDIQKIIHGQRRTFKRTHTKEDAELIIEYLKIRRWKKDQDIKTDMQLILKNKDYICNKQENIEGVE